MIHFSSGVSIPSIDTYQPHGNLIPMTMSPISLVCALLSFIRSSWNYNYAPIRYSIVQYARSCSWSNPNVFKIPNDDDDY